MDVIFYIKELLFKHDCVILPGFGGFVATYAPAKIQPVTHTFLPPSKNVLFNSKLRRDDGLLLDCISEHEGIDYEDARFRTSVFVHELERKLETGSKVLLSDLGSIYRDEEDNLQFEPGENINLLEDSFGLTSFVSLPVERKGIQKRIEKQFSDRRPVPEHENKKRRTYWAYLAVIPVLVILGWILIKSPVLNHEPTQRTGMVTLPETTASRTGESGVITKHKTATPLKDQDFTNNQEAENKDLPSGNDNDLQNPVVSRKYYIIGGAFTVPENADKLVAILRQKGYEAERAGLSKSGLHIVSYYSTPDKNEALLNLTLIRKNDNPSAWLLRK